MLRRRRFMSSDDERTVTSAVSFAAARSIVMASSSTPAGPINIANQLTVKLIEENYLFWHAQVLTALRSHGLMTFISKKFLCYILWRKFDHLECEKIGHRFSL